MYCFVIVLASLGLLSGEPAAQSDSVDHRFERATSAFMQGRYDRTVEVYRELLNDGYASAALYYNLGNAYVRLDQEGEAIRYYEKARQLRPTDDRVRHNLEQAQRHAGVYRGDIESLPPRGLRGVARDWSPFALFVSGLLLLGSGLSVAVIWTRPGRSGVLRHPLVWGPVAAGVLIIAVAMGTSYVQSNTQRAVVVADRAPLRGSPDEEAVPGTTLPEGTQMEVRGERSTWREVHLGDGRTGWVPAKALGCI